MVNIILEEMKSQWEKGYIKVLLIVILLISIRTCTKKLDKEI